MSSIVAFFGRLMLALMFLVSGVGKFSNLAGTDAMIQKVGMPAGLGLPTAIFEVVAGLAIALGVFTRLFSILLAGFCLLTAILYHNNFADQMQAAMFMKNVAIAGGFLVLFAQSHQAWSYDAMRDRRRADLATRDADLRAAKAEGIVEGVRTVPGTTTVVHD
ncbi:DoxX family protein [Parablastomonas sp. CN1-191]|uniref:DoxX family protein n=1 Tax=Parablastomonas sp. CN1-191 TaxID=3400908 RepID=UPI003BF8A497